MEYVQNVYNLTMKLTINDKGNREQTHHQFLVHIKLGTNVKGNLVIGNTHAGNIVGPLIRAGIGTLKYGKWNN